MTANVEALVNTVNTVGIMGKGIALMFKEAFPENFRIYQIACKRKEVEVGRMLVTDRASMLGARWIINFPTKRHWRNPSQIEWIQEGLVDLARVIEQYRIKSVALPPLGSGNGGLPWHDVRELVVAQLEPIQNVEILIFEPTREYQNVAKPSGFDRLTVARALIAEMIRRYSIIGIDCTLLEVHKLAYFLEKEIKKMGGKDVFDFRFQANHYGPHSARLTHLLNSLDGSYLHCGKRLADAGPFDAIRFEDSKKDRVAAYLAAEGQAFLPALDEATATIDGFESPLGLELLATVDWLMCVEGVPGSLSAIQDGLGKWPGREGSGDRKVRLFEVRMLATALQRLHSGNNVCRV